MFSGRSVCLELCQGCTPVTLTMYFCIYIKIAWTAMHMQTAAFLFCIYLFNFSSTLCTKRGRIKLCRLVGNMGIERESALFMGWRGTSP